MTCLKILDDFLKHIKIDYNIDAMENLSDLTYMLNLIDNFRGYLKENVDIGFCSVGNISIFIKPIHHQVLVSVDDNEKDFLLWKDIKDWLNEK